MSEPSLDDLRECARRYADDRYGHQTLRAVCSHYLELRAQDDQRARIAVLEAEASTRDTCFRCARIATHDVQWLNHRYPMCATHLNALLNDDRGVGVRPHRSYAVTIERRPQVINGIWCPDCQTVWNTRTLGNLLCPRCSEARAAIVVDQHRDAEGNTYDVTHLTPERPEPPHWRVSSHEVDLTPAPYARDFLFDCYRHFRERHRRQDRTDLVLLWESDFRRLCDGSEI